jgi:serine/threonine-protein kinase
MTPFPKVGAYTIDAELGRGAMGVVYRARDTRLDRSVAIKSLPPGFADDADLLARFEREARLMAGLSHPNIATVYGLEHAGTARFLVMELVEGETLAARLSRGALPLDEALSVAAQIAAGVEAAHDRGVVHRDLKPSNVMLQSDRTVKVLDFGLARDASKPATRHGGSTGEGFAVGTPGYMSPEQARGREVDRRTDIFAFGCVLYECLTGRAAFRGEFPVDAITATLEREPDWTLLPERTPPRVRDLLANCLAKDAKQRLRDIGDARMELERSIERREWTSTGSMRAAQPARRSWRVAIPWVVAIAALAVSAAAVWRPAQPVSRAVLRFDVNEPEIRERHEFDLAALAITPDGSTVCYSGTGTEDSLFVRRLSESASTPLVFPNTRHAHNPTFSLDGRWIVFQVRSQLFKIPVEGGQPIDLRVDYGLTKGHCWTERGIILSARVNGGLSLMDPNGGPLTTLSTPDRARGEIAHRWPDALPDGRHVLFTVKKDDIASFDEAEIALLDLETGTWKTLLKNGMFARYAPSGHIVYARAGALLAAPFDAEKCELSGAPVVVLQDVTTEPGSGAAQFAIARETGTLVYVTGGSNEPRTDLVWIERDGSSKPVGAPERNYYWCEFSPDGTRLALGVFGATDHVLVYDHARGTAIRVSGAGNASTPFWSRDGKRIAYQTDSDGTLGLDVVNADGTGKPQRLLDGEFPRAASFVTFEGKEAICFAKDGDVWIQPIGEKAPARAHFTTPFQESEPRVSPDQHWIAYLSDENGEVECYVRRFPSSEGKVQVSAGGGGSFPWWLPGSDGIVYTARGDILVARAVNGDFKDARPERIMAFPKDIYALYMVPDGSRFVGRPLARSTPSSGRVRAIVNWTAELAAKVPSGTR